MSKFIKRFLTLFILCICFNPLPAQFITVWNTLRSYAPQEITFPGSGSNYELTVTESGQPGPYAVYSNNSGPTKITNLTFNKTYIIEVTSSNPFTFLIANSRDHLALELITQWGGSDIKWNNFAGAFNGCTQLNVTATDIPNLSTVTSMANMFRDCSALIGNNTMNSWNTQNVNDMSNMFNSAHLFNQPIGNWNTQNVTTMNSMFNDATVFNQDLSNWNTGKVTGMAFMFSFAKAFNQPVGTWNTANVIYMNNMFNGAEAFNQPLNNWNTQNVEFMPKMFYLASTFNQPLNNWNTGKVTSMEQMFAAAKRFNQPLSSWNTANVTDMTQMFINASLFNQSLGSWNLSGQPNMQFMLNGTGMNPISYTNTLDGWAANPATPNGLNLGAQGLQYSSAAPNNGHSVLTTTVANGGKGWILGGEATADYTGNVYATFLPVNFGIMQAQIIRGQLNLHWQTLSETNNLRFDIEASYDGTDFSKIASMPSKAKDGTTAMPLDYSLSMNLNGLQKSLMGLPILLALIGVGFQRKKQAILLGIATLIIASLQYGCHKPGDGLAQAEHKKIMLRIVQVDKDGKKAYSKIIQAIEP